MITQTFAYDAKHIASPYNVTSLPLFFRTEQNRIHFLERLPVTDALTIKSSSTGTQADENTRRQQQHAGLRECLKCLSRDQDGCVSTRKIDVSSTLIDGAHAINNATDTMQTVEKACNCQSACRLLREDSTSTSVNLNTLTNAASLLYRKSTQTKGVLSIKDVIDTCLLIL